MLQKPLHKGNIKNVYFFIIGLDKNIGKLMVNRQSASCISLNAPLRHFVPKAHCLLGDIPPHKKLIF